MISLHCVRCPYCGESFETNVDPTGGNREYIEDCYVCCRPIVFRIAADADGNLLSVDLRRDNE